MTTDIISPEIVREFSALPLHDGILYELRLDWEQRTCIAFISAFVTRGQDAVRRQILWRDVSEVSVPHRNPWGPSVCINRKSVDSSGVFVIEMQSGDEITIHARAFEFV
jgi:hypothetical protein